MLSIYFIKINHISSKSCINRSAVSSLDLISLLNILIWLSILLSLWQIILEILCYKSNWTLHGHDSSTLTFHLFLSQLENGIVQQGAEGVLEELPDWHLLVLILVLDDLEHLLYHVVVRAWLNSLLEFSFALVCWFDLLDEEIYFFLEKVMALSSIILIMRCELDFLQAFVLFE